LILVNAERPVAKIVFQQYHTCKFSLRAGSTMYRHLLIATDGSELAASAVAGALSLAKAIGARVTAVTVTDIFPTGPYSPVPMPSVIEHYETSAAESAGKILASVSKAAEKIGITCDTIHVKDQAPADGIVAVAAEKECDLIVMASHGRRGVSRMLLGSQAQKVVTQSPVSVLIYR
jgi:nucleotide-binding universal stress UspA family protein